METRPSGDSVLGYRLTFVWEDRKRRRESDLAAVATFYRLYGEFFAAWKLWDPEAPYPEGYAVPCGPRVMRTIGCLRLPPKSGKHQRRRPRPHP